MKQLCDNCPLRELHGGPYDQTVDSIRANPQDLHDVEQVLLLPKGQSILGALNLGRPERCVKIREYLPGAPHSTARRRPFAECPELWLAGKLVEKKQISA